MKQCTRTWRACLNHPHRQPKVFYQHLEFKINFVSCLSGELSQLRKSLAPGALLPPSLLPQSEEEASTSKDEDGSEVQFLVKGKRILFS